MEFIKTYPSKGKLKYVFHGGNLKKAGVRLSERSLERLIETSRKLA